MFKPDSSLMQGIDEWIEKNKEAFVKDLDRLVAMIQKRNMKQSVIIIHRFLMQ